MACPISLPVSISQLRYLPSHNPLIFKTRAAKSCGRRPIAAPHRAVSRASHTGSIQSRNDRGLLSQRFPLRPPPERTGLRAATI